MSRLQWLVAGFLVALLPGPPAQGADEVQPPRRPEADVRRPEQGFLPPGVIERLDLNDAQREKAAKLQKELQEKLQAAERKHREALEQARQNQDRQKAEEATQAFRKEVAGLQEEFQGQVQKLLTEEQQKRLAELRRDQPPGGRPGIGALPRILEQIDLTAEQKEKVAKVVQESQEKQETAQKKFREAVEQARQNQDREKFRELAQALEKDMAKLQEQLQGQVQQLLNDEQKKKFAEFQRRLDGAGRPAFPGIGQLMPMPVQERLELTEEQREKIAKLQKEAEAKLREILTEEQNRRFEELRKGSVPPERRRPPEP